MSSPKRINPMAHKAWLGVAAFLMSLLGTLMLRSEQLYLYAAILLIAAGAMSVAIWRGQRWPAAFPPGSAPLIWRGKHLWSFAPMVGAGLLALLADLSYTNDPGATFGLAGWLWLLSIALLASAAPIQALLLRARTRTPRPEAGGVGPA